MRNPALRLGTDTLPPAIFAGHPEQADLAARLSADSPLTIASLESAYREAKEGASVDADVIRAMLATARSGTPRNTKPWLLNVHEATVDQTLDTLDRALSLSLGKLLVGQDDGKVQMRRAVQSLFTAYSDKPRGMLFVGPPGCGKSLAPEALALAIYGDRDALAYVDCAGLDDETKFNRVFGAPPGYKGTVETLTEKNSPICQAAIDSTFSWREPVIDFGERAPPKIILLDEVDKIGNGDPDIQKTFWNMWLGAFQRGTLTFNNGETVDLRNAIIIMTSNAGDEKAAGLEGEAASRVYETATREVMPGPMLSRLKERVVAFRRLAEEEVGQVAEGEISRRIDETMRRLRDDRAVNATVRATSDAAHDFGLLGFHPVLGARLLEGVLEDVLDPLLYTATGQIQDEERWVLRRKESWDSGTFAGILARFRDNKSQMPKDMSAEDLPFELVPEMRRPKFYDYDGPMPLSDVARPYMWSSGALGGEGFLLFNRGESDSSNELRVLIPGGIPEQDTFAPVELPPVLARANLLDATPVGDNLLFVRSISIPSEDAKTPDTHGFFYRRSTETWTETDAPPALLDAAMVGVEDKVLLTGGRLLKKRGDNWSYRVAESPEENPNNGAPISAASWVLDADTTKRTKWRPIDATMQSARAGVATQALGSEAWLMGGEENFRLVHGSTASRATSLVDKFDARTETIKPAAASLHSPTAYATAFIDPHGTIDLAGGVDLVNEGETVTTKRAMLRLDTDREEEGWNAKLRLPAPGRNLATIVRGAGVVMGPFYTEEDPLRARFAYYR